MKKTVLTLLAHPDDAEILCAGTLLRLAGMGWEVHIATATAGDCGTMTEDRWQISARRTAEARHAAEMVGGRYHCLGEMDGRVVYDKGTIGKAIDLFRAVAPSLVFTHALRDYMVDHEQTALLARTGSFLFGAPNASDRPRVEGSSIPHLYYCDPLEGLDPYGQEVRPTTLVDVSAVIEKKAEMLGRHASQREWLRAHHGMDEYVEAMRRFGAERGTLAGCGYAEGFVQHRGHGYPGGDLLREILR